MKYKTKNRSNLIECSPHIGGIAKTRSSRWKRCVTYNLIEDIIHDKFDKDYDTFRVITFKNNVWDRVVFLRKEIISFYRII